MNFTSFTGHITADLELKTTTNDKKYCKFNLAVNYGWKDNKKTSFIRCMVWEGRATALANHCKKGSKILVEGHIETGSYEDSSGTKIYTTDNVIDKLEFLDSKNTEGKTDRGSQTDKDDIKDDLPF